MFLTLPAGPGCERCSSRTYVAAIEPHPEKLRHTRYKFECPRCYHMMKMTVAPRGKPQDDLARAAQFVANAQLRIDRQAILIRRLRALGRDFTRAEALLEVLQDSLSALQRHQDYLVRKARRADGAGKDTGPEDPGPT